MNDNRDAADLMSVNGTIRPRSNWETHLFDQVNQLVFQMTRMPDGHDFHLDANVARRAADLLGAIQANSRLDAPRVINEEGDTILFTWEEFGLKKYLCIDNEEVELRIRKPGTQFSTSEPLTHDGHVDISVLLNALGAEVRSGSVR
ncbi:hypothetical protein GCM10011345_24540 [Gemmobacter megaterium]|nr:hypothetical protein GCM10011345_24540 [Gemmobacter megaterium]